MDLPGGLSGFLGLRWIRLAGQGEFTIEFKVGIQENLMVNLGFGEHYIPVVPLQFSVFRGVAEDDDGLRTLVRFEPNLLLSLFGSEF